MPILFLIACSVILASVLKGKRRRKRSLHKAVRFVASANLTARSQTIKAPQRDVEKERLMVCRDYNRRLKAELEHKQAQEDIYHLEQRKADLLKAYRQLPDDDTERTIKKRIAYDNSIRTADKQIEKAYMILKRTY